MNQKPLQWSQTIWHETQPIIDQILRHPFITALQQGSLAPETFSFYIQQDALYLKQYGRALANLIPKLQQPSHVEAFLGFIQDTLTVEQSLHQSYLNSIDHATLESSPTCLLYTQFLLAATSMEPAPVGVAAILPCFVIYKYVGDHILTLGHVANNPYENWIQAYASPDFAEAVRKAITIADELASTASRETRARMDEAYTTAAKMEYLFWHSAYAREPWPI